MNVISAVPTQQVTEQLSVQPLADLAGAQKLRANVWTLAPGDWSWGRHVHSEQEELYLVLDGRLRVEADGETVEVGSREAVVVPAGSAHQLWNAGDEPVSAANSAQAPRLETTSPPGRRYSQRSSAS